MNRKIIYKTIKTAPIAIYAAISGLFLIVDQILKWYIRHNKPVTDRLDIGFLRWEYFENTGIAFSIPFPQGITILVTPLILLGLATYALYRYGKNTLIAGGAMLICGGAISNFIDRVLFNATIDYLAVFTAVINLADIMILIGGILLIAGSRKEIK